MGTYGLYTKTESAYVHEIHRLKSRIGNYRKKIKEYQDRIEDIIIEHLGNNYPRRNDARDRFGQKKL